MSKRPPFHPDKDFVVTQSNRGGLLIAGERFAIGAIIDKKLLDPDRLELLYNNRVLCFKEDYRTSDGRYPYLEPTDTLNEVRIPENWEELTWQKRRQLAAQLTSDPVRNAADAARAIRNALAKRTEAA